MNKTELENRTKCFALSVIKLVSSLPSDKVGNVVGYQLLKSGTSIGANYREALRAVSKTDFINKIGIVEKEANETVYWLELVKESNMVPEEGVSPLVVECGELLAIFTATGKSAKRYR